MIAEYNRKSLSFGIPGLVLQIVCYIAINVAAANGSPLVSLFRLGVIIGLILLVIGLGYYAKAKGYSVVFGLLGLLSLIGLIILAVLPDKAK